MINLNFKLPIKISRPSFSKWRHDQKLAWWRRLLPRTGLPLRGLSLAAALLIASGIGLDIFNAWNFASSYELSPQVLKLLPKASAVHAGYLELDEAERRIDYNTGYTPSASDTSQSARPRFQASFQLEPSEGVTVTDPVNSIGVSFKPKFRLNQPQIQSSRLVYPLRGRDGAKVVTLGTAGFKEDIVLNKEQGDEAAFDYEMVLPSGVEARLESDGSIGFYGPDSALLGNVSTATEADAELLDKARQNSAKTKLLFTIPAPIILEGGRTISSATASFALAGSSLTINASGLKSANYPLSIDPSIYVETAAKLMRGNNETNIDFDVDRELIQKSQTTGARIDAWEGNLDMSEGIWDHGTAVAGGYIYRTGGRTGAAKPQLLSEQTTDEATDDTSFQMTMPAERPAGDLYIALMCHDNAAVTVTEASGWTELADIGEFAAYYKIGTDQGGGNESANYTFTLSGSEAKSGTIVRVSGFNASDPISGIPGTDSGTNEIPDFPATTPDNSASLIIRAVGADNDIPSPTGWVPSGHTKIASSNSGGGDCGFAAASLDSPPSAGSPAAAVSLADNSLNDTWGGLSVAINPASSSPPPVIAGQQSSQQASNSNSFTMAMPATRPAGDLYIAMMCHDGTGNVSPPGGGGWTEYADGGGGSPTTNEHAAYWKIGTDQGGGNEAANYTWNMTTGGSTEVWAGVIIRVTGFDSSDPVSGTPGSGTGGSGAPTFPSTTPDNNSTLVIRAAGADNDVPHPTNWIPSAHTKIDSGGPGTTGDCGYAAAFMNNSPASGITTGTAAFGAGSGIDDSWGASSIAINPDPSAGGFDDATRPTVNWAKFNPSTLAIESPNPGEGVCTDWCGNAVYDLPEPRHGHSMVAYNGYLYVIGGVDDNDDRVSTVYIAKLGANGEPSLWHPTDTDKNNWEYWYEDTGLSSSTERSYMSVAVYNNRMYVSGGQTDADPGGTTTMEYAEIRPNGTLGSWSSGQTLPGAGGRHGHTTHIYNDVIYLIGGNINGTLQNTIYYSRLNSDGSMNAWVQTSSFTTARSTMGGSFTAVWGAYIYLAGGCSAVNGSGYCTAVEDDTQLASINADGSLAPWNEIIGLANQRIGHTFTAWQGGLYRLGGCTAQDPTSGNCLTTLADVDYGVINQDGDASTVSNSEPENTAPCDGGSPTNCDLPPVGDGAGQGGQMSSMVVINNGYIYNIGGCIDSTDSCDSNMSGNVSYSAISSTGTLVSPPSCSGTSYGHWCVDSTNRINGTAGLGAAGSTVFNNTIYIAGGTNSTAWQDDIWRVSVNPDGSLAGAWTDQSFGSLGLGGTADDARGYMYMFTRANPNGAGTTPGNLYMLGGCSSTAGIGCSTYNNNTIKCDIAADTSISSCTTNDQLPVDADNIAGGDQGLGLMAGTIYANRIYLVGGSCTATGAAGNPCGSTYAANRKDTIYARIDDSNNIVVEPGNTSWAFATAQMSPVRRRAVSFGYNGYIYSLAGYSGTESLQDLLFSKIDVSTGDMGPWSSSGVVVTPRWDLRAIVSNGYVYAVGGCGNGAAPGDCTATQPEIQTFQLYNNDSGAPVSYSAGANLFSTDRLGASSVIYNGYIYVAGGCTSTTDCTNATNSVQRAALDNYGGIGSWSATTADLPADRAWGQLEVAGGTLYYIGGQSDTATDERAEVYYGTPGGGGDITAWSTASNSLPAARSQHAATVWNDRIYVSGGNDTAGAAQNTVYISPQLDSGGDIGSAWASETDVFDVARNGHTTIAYANNLYVLGGFDGSNYLSDVQFSQINTDGTLDEWSFSTSLPTPIRQGDGFAANGYMYLIGGRSNHFSCASNTLVTPISANTTIASGNNPTGIGEWYETNQRYTGDRYGAAVSYHQGKIYAFGGGCPSDPSNPATSVLEDNFDPGLDGADWTSTTSMNVGTTCGSVSGNNLRGTAGTAAATTIDVDVRYGGTVTFDMRIPTSNAGGCNQPEAGEDVQLQYSINDGGSWVTIDTYDETTCCNAWTGFEVSIPFAAQTSDTRFRWQIINAEADDHWALDDVEIFANAAPDSSQIWEDNFDPSIDGGDWSSTSNTNVGTNCGTITSGNSLVSTGGPNAVAETIDVDVAYGAVLTFDLRIPTSDTGTCNAPEAGEDLNLQYSINGGGNWTTIATYDESDYNTVTRLGVIIPTAAQTAATRFRWNMPGADGTDDEWAIDEVSIAAVTLEPVYTSTNRVVQTALLSQPQVAKYSRLIDTDTDVFPNAWLMNGIDNSIGASWQVRYRSMNDTDGIATDCGSADMTTWGQETNFGDVTLGNVEEYTPLDGSGNNINCARYFYFFISIDASQTFGYPEDVERGPTIADITLFFTSDPSKRLRHGKTFTGGEKQPLDTPCRVSGGGPEHANCPLP